MPELLGSPTSELDEDRASVAMRCTHTGTRERLENFVDVSQFLHLSADIFKACRDDRLNILAWGDALLKTNECPDVRQREAAGLSRSNEAETVDSYLWVLTIIACGSAGWPKEMLSLVVSDRRVRHPGSFGQLADRHTRRSL